jgi:acyl carrier protein
MDVQVEQVVKTVGEYVTKTRGTPKAPITADTKLYQEGHVDSFGLVDLIADLETALAIDLPPGALIPEDFESPRVLWSRIREL